MHSCFNLFFLPEQWWGYFAFEKQVDASVFGGAAGSMTHVGLRCVPMGWINSVDVIQNFIWRFVFGICGVCPSLEIAPNKVMPQGDAAIVCMDGFDLVSRHSFNDKYLERISAVIFDDNKRKSPVMANFVKQCELRGLTLNAGKEVINAANATVLGGELDGVGGRLRHSREKGVTLCKRALALLSMREVPQVAVQHWAGSFCFAAGFRRSLFSTVSEVFSFIVSFEDQTRGKLVMPPDVSDEVLVACSLLPLAAASLRAPLRQYLSISDASEDGGFAAVAYRFTTHLDKPYAAELLDRTANVNEESSTVSRSDNVIFCVVCLEETPLYNIWGGVRPWLPGEILSALLFLLSPSHNLCGGPGQQERGCMVRSRERKLAGLVFNCVGLDAV